MYKVYYAQKYRIRKYESLNIRINKLRHRVDVREKYRSEKKIKQKIRYNVVKDSNKSSFQRTNTLFKARKQVNV